MFVKTVTAVEAQKQKAKEPGTRISHSVFAGHLTAMTMSKFGVFACHQTSHDTSKKPIVIVRYWSWSQVLLYV